MAYRIIDALTWCTLYNIYNDHQISQLLPPFHLLHTLPTPLFQICSQFSAIWHFFEILVPSIAFNLNVFKAVFKRYSNDIQTAGLWWWWLQCSISRPLLTSAMHGFIQLSRASSGYLVCHSEVCCFETFFKKLVDDSNSFNEPNITEQFLYHYPFLF